MDNDNKIRAMGDKMQNTDQRHKEVLLFLNDELNRLQTTNSSSSYDLEKEYAKTRKNKSPFVFLLLFSSIVIVFLASWGMTAHIKKQNENITVNLEEFEGLNIKNLLDSVSKVQSNYDAAMKNKMNIISDRDTALRKAEEKRDNDLFLIESLKLDKKSEAKRRDAVLTEYNESVALINEAYDPQITLAENELAEYKKQLDEYDTSKLEAARQQEQALDSERRLHQLEIDKISESYENRIQSLQTSYAEERKNHADQIKRSVNEVSTKYQAEIDQLDPDLKNDPAQAIVTVQSILPGEDFNSAAIIQANEIEDPTVKEGLDRFQKSYDQYNQVHKPFESIPYKKSAPLYIASTKKLVQSMGSIFKDFIVKTSDEKKQLNSEIKGLNTQINDLKRNHEIEKQTLKKNFADEKAQLAADYTGIYDGILASVKANAVVISAHEKDKIRIYVIESQRSHITSAGVAAEIKASKSVKGVIKPIEDEPGFYLFESALDKAGNPVDFDFSLISAGQIVKVSAK